MTNSDTSKNLELDQFLDHGDILYSRKDKNNFRQSLDAVTEHSMGLAVIGDNEATLTHYSRIFISRLRKERELNLEIFPSTNTEELLNKFNQLLSQMTMDQARQNSPAHKPVTLMLVNDANVVEPEQWKLLLQLLSDFPGINIRMVLFINKATWPRYDETLMLLGRNIYRWDIKIPSVLEAKELVAVAQGTIYEREATLLLSNVGHHRVTTGTKTQGEPDQMAFQNQQTQIDKKNQIDGSKQQLSAKADVEGIKKDPGNSERLGRGPIVAGLLVAFLVVSVLIAEYSDLLTNISGEPKKEDVHNKILPNSLLPKDKDNEKIEPDDVGGLLPQNSSLDERYRSVLSDPRPKSEAAVLQSQRKAGDLPSDFEIEEVEGGNKDKKGEQNITGQLRSRAAQTFFVQHIVLNSNESIGSYMAEFPALANAWILPISSKGNKNFGVISGPFSSRDEATEFVAGPGVPEDFFLWEAGQLREWCKTDQKCDL